MIQDIAFRYAAVRQKRLAIETAKRLLNEVDIQARLCRVIFCDYLQDMHKTLDYQDSLLFDEEQELYHQLSK